jgi:hypothetical protein
MYGSRLMSCDVIVLTSRQANVLSISESSLVFNSWRRNGGNPVEYNKSSFIFILCLNQRIAPIDNTNLELKFKERGNKHRVQLFSTFMPIPSFFPG